MKYFSFISRLYFLYKTLFPFLQYGKLFLCMKPMLAVLVYLQGTAENIGKINYRPAVG